MIDLGRLLAPVPCPCSVSWGCVWALDTITDPISYPCSYPCLLPWVPGARELLELQGVCWELPLQLAVQLLNVSCAAHAHSQLPAGGEGCTLKGRELRANSWDGSGFPSLHFTASRSRMFPPLARCTPPVTNGSISHLTFHIAISPSPISIRSPSSSYDTPTVPLPGSRAPDTVIDSVPLCVPPFLLEGLGLALSVLDCTSWAMGRLGAVAGRQGFKIHIRWSHLISTPIYPDVTSVEADESSQSAGQPLPPAQLGQRDYPGPCPRLPPSPE